MPSPFKIGILASLESVDFQDRSFGDQITSIVSDIYSKLETKLADSNTIVREPEVKLLEDFIFRKKGLRVKLVCNSEVAAILPFYPNKNFSMLEDYFRGNFTIHHQQGIIDNANKKKGTIDLKTGKVGGLFSEGTSILYMNFNVLRTMFKMSPSETTACMIHELGHAYTACAYSDRFTRTNQVLANASREIFKKSGKKNLDYVFKELKTINKDVTIEEVDSIVNGDRIIAGARWHKFLINEVVSELENDKYNRNSFEQTSDSYAARHGYGKELVIALDKMHSSFGSSEKYAVIRWINYAMELFVLYILPFAMIAAVVTLSLTGLLVSMLILGAIYTSGDAGRNGTYDELKQRYIRIRAELIVLLKDENIPKKVVADTVGQIKIMDTAINSSVDIYGPYRFVSNIIFSNNRNARKSAEYQKQLEALVNNDMFMYAAQLKNI